MNSETTTYPMLSVQDLRVHFPIRQGIIGTTVGSVKAVDGITFSIPRGEVFALVGESGCGKTTTAQAIAGLTEKTSGTVTFAFVNSQPQTIDWIHADAALKKQLRRKMQIIFQDPYSSLDPRMTIQAILEEPFTIHNIGSKATRRDRIAELCRQVGLAPEYLSRYPHEFSGGQRQRIGIARALATEPEFIIADEPVSALDVSIQAQIINLMQELCSRYRQTQLFISHDLAVVRHIASTIAVMYRGTIVEYGSEADLFSRPRHPYTIMLLDSVPIPGKGRKQRGNALPDDSGTMPPVSGCQFFHRCPRRLDDCKTIRPILTATSSTQVACFNPFP